MICIWSNWCHCHPIISCSSKIQNGLPFCCQLTQVVLEKAVAGRGLRRSWCFISQAAGLNHLSQHVSDVRWVHCNHCCWQKFYSYCIQWTTNAPKFSTWRGNGRLMEALEQLPELLQLSQQASMWRIGYRMTVNPPMPKEGVKSTPSCAFLWIIFLSRDDTTDIFCVSVPIEASKAFSDILHTSLPLTGQVCHVLEHIW